MSESSEVVYTTDFPKEIDHALVIYCSDPWYRQSTVELFDELGLENYDQFVVPGSAANLLLTSAVSTSLVDKPRIKMLYALHALKKVVVVSHFNCAYYQNKYPGFGDAERKKKQILDLVEARQEIRLLAPGVEIALYYAEARDGKVSFTLVE